MGSTPLIPACPARFSPVPPPWGPVCRLRDGLHTRFGELAEEHKWKHTGKPTWRSRVIYQTNLRTAYQAGRYKQMTDPEVLAARPLWQYFHGGSMNPRPDHLSWDGKILRHDDPWWDTHYPPNGWGCTCTVHTLSQAEADAKGLHLWEQPEDGENEDEAWRYNVGEAAWGRPKATWKVLKANEKGWTSLVDFHQADSGPAAELPIRPGKAEVLPHVESMEEAIAQAERVLGAKQKIFTVGADNWQQKILVDAEVLIRHLYQKVPPDPKRVAFFARAVETLEDPTEAWVCFWRSAKSGKVALRTHLLRLYQGGKDGKGMVVSAEVHDGVLTGWTFVPDDPSRINDLRVGKRIVGA